MGEAEVMGDPQLFPKTVGERLRDARVAQGLDLAEIAARTRIPQRHLDAIETSSYSSLPSITYVMGFCRAYARAVGVDDVELSRELRRELAGSYHRDPPRVAEEFREPRRVPSAALAIGALVVAIVAIVAVGLIYAPGMFAPGEAPVAEQARVERDLGIAPQPAPVASAGGVSARPDPAAAAAAAPTSAGQVTLTAKEEVWVRVYDASNETLVMKTLAPGERYDVPMNADRPMINVGRPDQLTVTINGSQVAPLGDGSRAIKDVGISAEALRGRGGAPTATVS
ncbi:MULTISPECIES: helix-turn-helix domain-containing protein [unclassified Sphingomonas]|uniref:helix-turn-helix domain-containing protein n=1 Tax=unclassified Sphingomonas TaxID=196159 RepID=UPI000AF5D6CE|nr:MULTISPECIES: helix-turn-helix domain-containing protein [unclassified Sphingomonas]